MGNLGTSKFPIFINEYEYLQRDYHKLKIMAEIPFLVKDLALILMVAGIVTLIFKRLKQPLVLGYIVAGFPVRSPLLGESFIYFLFLQVLRCFSSLR